MVNYPHDTLRTVASEARTVRQAWAAHPQSESARAAFCRPYGLHAVQNPYHRIPGMDIGYGVYSGAAFARLLTKAYTLPIRVLLPCCMKVPRRCGLPEKRRFAVMIAVTNWRPAGGNVAAAANSRISVVMPLLASMA